MDKILEKTLSYEGIVYGRHFYAGGIKVYISYDPVRAYIPDIPENHIFDMGQDVVAEFIGVLNYVHEKIPTIREIQFDDLSKIYCEWQPYPADFCYFSIAFTGATWYEKYFNARQGDADKHRAYREKIQDILYSEKTKGEIDFLQFLRTSRPTVEIVDELERYYDNTKTFGEFFQALPKGYQYCDWISNFIRHHLKGIFETQNWIIDLPIIHP